MSRREIGVHQSGDSWVVVFPSRETRDGYRSISFPMEAWAVIRGALVPQSPATYPPRKTAVVDALKKRNHQSIGSLVNSALEALGEDSEDMVLRKRMCGLINTLTEEGAIVRRMDGNKEIFSFSAE